MQIIFEECYAIHTCAQVIVNSANAWLFADSSGAGAIRESTPLLTNSQLTEYNLLFERLPKIVQEFFIQKQTEHGWKMHVENLSCLRLLASNGFSPFKLGSAIIDFDLSCLDDKLVIHAITMSYDPETKQRITATPESITGAIESSIQIMLEHGKHSLALPIPCARPDYGLTPEESYQIVKSVLSKYSDRAITIHLCFDNDFTKEFLAKKVVKKNS